MIGTKLGAYEIIEEIGKGGMAVVYKAFHDATQRHVAIKMIHIDVSDDKDYLARFEREVRLVASLQHIHILPVFDYGQHEGNAYLVMPLIVSGTLKHHMQAQRLKLNEIVRIFAQVADAVNYAHGKGILHRDIKPDNVLIDDRGNVLLGDFGIARFVESVSSLTGDRVIGTPAYMSPEQGQGILATPQSDIYSLGVLLFEMITGDLPYWAESAVAIIMQHISGAVPSIIDKNLDIPKAVNDVIQKAMAKKPNDRFDSASAMSQALYIATQDVLTDKFSSAALPIQTTSHVTPVQTRRHYHVFMSYRRTDTEMMRRITKSLEDAGLSVWTDEGIEVGSPSWKQAIQFAIQNTDGVVCILSPEAAQSRWVREELDFADLHQKPIFLAHISGGEREVILFGFSTSQRIDLRDENLYTENINTLSKAIRSRIGLDTKPQTTPAAVVRQYRRGVYFYPNRFALNTISAIEDVVGSAELQELLALADLESLISNPPPNNDKKEFDFADFSALNAGLDEKYGNAAGAGLRRSVGRATFLYGNRNHAFNDVTELAMKILPIQTRLSIGIPLVARIFRMYSDQVSEVHDAGEYFIYTISRCPMCWGYRTDKVFCHLGQGLLQRGAEWISGGKTFNVEIETCIAKGDDIGRYRIYKEPIE